MARALPKRYCKDCNRKLDRRAVGDYCIIHHLQHRLKKVKTVLTDESKIATKSIKPLKVTGSVIVVSDTHIPFHHSDGMWLMIQIADRLKIKTLIIAGDLIHADIISKYLGVGKQIKLTDELVSCGRVLEALTTSVFDRIIVIPGNHDQRIEKMIAGFKESKQGRQALEIVAGLLGVSDVDDAEAVAYRYLNHFFSNDKVTIHNLPNLILNDIWLIQHPGTVSRISPQNERRMIEKHRKSVIQGHSHLWSIGFDSSGTDIAFNCGHLSRPDKWRYLFEKPTTFPQSVPGFGIILCTKEHPNGKLIPVALHEKMMDPLALLDYGESVGREAS